MKLLIPAPVHTIFEIAAFFVGFRYYVYLKKKQGDLIPVMNRIWIIVGATAGALIGSRIVGAFEDPDWLKDATFANVFAAFNNKTIVGGLYGGLFGVELTKYFLKEKNRSGDLFVFPILLALIIGRIGCFLTALQDHTAGGPTSLPWGIDYGDGIQRHPLPLYEILFLVGLWIALCRTKQSQKFSPGALFMLFMSAYTLYRFGMEFLKTDYLYPWNLSAIQTMCVIGLIYYYRVLFRPKTLLAYA
jgi:phosphatidylglycerol---prolipoprotein diacylglyceryl transferase